MDVNEETDTSLQWPDYIVIGVVLLISSLTGIYYRFSGGRQKTTAEYFSANNTMSIPMLAIAMPVAMLSAIAMMGISSEFYVYGAQLVVMTVGYMLATPIVAFFFLPVFYRLQNLSVYEYLEKRFGVTARLTASIAHYVQMALYTGVVLYAPSLALEATTGLSSTVSIVVIGLVCIFYSSVGGIKAILATDVFQGLLMFATILCVILIGCHDIEGGLPEAWKIADKTGRLDVINFDMDPTVRHTWWSLVIGGIGLFIADFGTNQVHVQRMLSARSLKSAQIALFLSSILANLMILLTAFSGLVLYAWFFGCDPLTSGEISSFDQVLPYFAKVRLSKVPGLLGFFVAGVFSACLSSVSALLNAQAAIAIGDYIKPLCRKFGWEFPDSKATLIGKMLCVVSGILCVGIAFLAANLGSLLQTAMSINGAIGGPLTGLFSLGMFVESANEKGAVIGAVVSFIFSGWVNFGLKPRAAHLPVFVDRCGNMSHLNDTSYPNLVEFSNVDDSDDYFYLYRLSYMWNNPMGFAGSVIIGYIASIVVRHCSKTPIDPPDPDLFIPIVASRMRRRRKDLAKRLVMYAWFNGCDPVVSGKIASYDQIMAHFAKVRMSEIPALLGLFIAGIFSATLGTTSAILNSLSAIAVADSIKPLYRIAGKDFPEKKASFIAKILGVVNGLLCMAIAFIAAQMGSLLQTTLAIKGAFGGPILGLFSLGLFVEIANQRGAVIGTVLSLAIFSWISFGQPKPTVPQLPVSIDECVNATLLNFQAVDSRVDDLDYFYLYRISYMWYTPLGFAMTMIFGYIASYAVRYFGNEPLEKSNPDLFTPMIANRIRRRLEAKKKPASEVYTVKIGQY